MVLRLYKKDMLVEAGKTLFNNADTKIIVRLPKAGDEKLHNPASVELPQDTKRIETKEEDSKKK